MTTLKVVGNPSHRRYSRRQKAVAVVTAELASATAAAEKLGVPRRTIGYWLERPEFAELRRKTRAETAEGFGVIARMAQDRLMELIPTMEPRDLTVLLGVATDKDQLLSGQATSRDEHRELLGDFDDHEREAMSEWLRQVALERVDAPDPA